MGKEFDGFVGGHTGLNKNRNISVNKTSEMK